MTDNRTTELRGKLTERGVEYRGDDASYTFATHWTDSLGRGCSFVEEVYDGVSKTIFVSEPSARNITPEQAVAATLGSELGSGTLTAEQVREAIACNSWQETSMLFEFNDSSWQAIADELNARAERREVDA